MLSSVLLLLAMCVSCYAVGLETLSQPVITAFLSGHNKLRSPLGLPDLVWNSSLVSVAESHVEYCDFLEGGNSFIAHWDGELKFKTTTPEFPTYPAASALTPPTKPDNLAIANTALESWSSEANNVDPGWACIIEGTCRIYSLLVWRNTKSVGCAIFNCGEDDASVVKCEYDPEGNIYGEIPY